MINITPFKGIVKPTEGYDRNIECAKKPTDLSFWVLVDSGLEDLAQALLDTPEFMEKIKVCRIGSPNKKFCKGFINTYDYRIASPGSLDD